MKFIDNISRWRPVRLIGYKARQVVLPGFEGVSLYDAFEMFFKAFYYGAIGQRAASIAFSFFLAIFPTILFFFTLIPYLPYDNLDVMVLKLIHEAVPESIYELINSLVEDIVNRSHFGLMSFGFITAFVFATGGFRSIISAFNTSIQIKKEQSFWKLQWTATILLVIVSLLVLVFLAVLLFYQFFINYFADNEGLFFSSSNYSLIVVGNWVLQITLIYFIFSFIFYFGPKTSHDRYKFFSAGSTFSTILFIIFYFLFNYYATNFAQYNALYGSIGTLILFMMWIYFNAYILLIGFELNAAIKSGKIRQHHYWDIFNAFDEKDAVSFSKAKQKPESAN